MLSISKDVRDALFEFGVLPPELPGWTPIIAVRGTGQKTYFSRPDPTSCAESPSSAHALRAAALRPLEIPAPTRIVRSTNYQTHQCIQCPNS